MRDVTACVVTLPRVCAFEFSLCDKVDMCVVRALLLAQVTPPTGGEGQHFWHLPTDFLTREPVHLNTFRFQTRRETGIM
jgi:hypothetical protein